MNYEIYGYFYVDENYGSCRTYLDIKRKNNICQQPQLMVVMMNPGKSKPINGNDNGRILTPTNPDPTQDQIMKIMDKKNILCTRILNLSDIRDPDSDSFYTKIKACTDTTHSIFDPSRSSELSKLFIPNIPTIFAWGVDDSLKELADLAVDSLNISKPFGILKEDTKYYHARPRLPAEQKTWVKDVLKQMSGVKFYYFLKKKVVFLILV